jgi:hypothetical protein
LTITVVPGATDNDVGLKSKFLMTIVDPEVAEPFEVVVIELFVPDEHAARPTDAMTMIATASQPREDGSPIRLGWTWLRLLPALFGDIGGSSEQSEFWMIRSFRCARNFG